MRGQADSLDDIERRLAGTGLFVRGAFHPDAADGVRPLGDGRPAGTVVLVGNAGPAMWAAFRRDVPDPAGKDPLDNWVDAHLERAAEGLGAEIVFATRKPWPPIQRWALKAGGVHRSPIGILIHPEYGLWHVYRGALLFARKLALPSAPATANPCESCAKKPCLTVCPADAFKPEAFDMQACVGHVESPKGKACAAGGCLARRACPVGRAHAYVRDEGAFHMAAVVRTVRRIELVRRGGANPQDT
ncbi:MAG: hypothetical protein JNM29_09280 [Candidatus Odyssella sp.]|nr:hypothetical protein [Candidatus Odyssella sp.]